MVFSDCPRLTHWGRATHICVSKLTIIASENGLSPGRRQAIIWNNAGILSIGLLGTKFSEILIGVQTFSFKKMHLKMSSAKWRPFCPGLNVLIHKLVPLPSTQNGFLVLMLQTMKNKHETNIHHALQEWFLLGIIQLSSPKSTITFVQGFRNIWHHERTLAFLWRDQCSYSYDGYATWVRRMSQYCPIEYENKTEV